MTRVTIQPKIRPGHLSRRAVVYVRQSSPHQVRNNRESSSRQYALVERAKMLGWAGKSVEIIDEDQARSGPDPHTGRASRRSWRRSAPARSVWCWRWRPRDWRGRRPTGTGWWRSAW
jgi:hypothetical protein